MDQGIEAYLDIRIAHTADWALKVWSVDLPGLFREAALGMYALMDVQFGAPTQPRRLELSAHDPESLLVGFLSELLYFVEGVGFPRDFSCPGRAQPGCGLTGFSDRWADKESKGCHLSQPAR
jgi:hypothetical protein